MPLSLSPRPSFLVTHGVLIPVSLMLLAVLLRTSTWDYSVTAFFFDPTAGGFPARHWGTLEDWGHRGAKAAVLGLWLLVLVLAILASWHSQLLPHRKLLWLTVLAMGLGPVVVALLKDMNAHPCPWDLSAFGGIRADATDWFVPRDRAGRCFPGGHAAGGFSLIALAFAAAATGASSRARWLMATAVCVGLSFSAVRIVQGAHFLSHNIWSAAIDWAVAAWVLAPKMPQGHEAALPWKNPASKW